MLHHFWSFTIVLYLLIGFGPKSRTKNHLYIDDYVFHNQVGFRTINVENNDIVNLRSKIKDINTFHFYKNNYDKYCIISIKNSSSKDIYLEAVDSCITVTSFSIEGKHLGKHQRGDSIIYDGSLDILLDRWNKFSNEKEYIIGRNKTVNFYLPYKTEDIEVIKMKVNYYTYEAIPKKKKEAKHSFFALKGRLFKKSQLTIEEVYVSL